MAVAPVVNVVLSLYAAKTAIDGVREGNIMKAVVGGVGAYMGFSNLGSMAAAGEQAATQSASDVAASELSNVAKNAAVDSAKNAGVGVAQNSAEVAAAATKTAGVGAGTGAQVTTNAASGGGLIDSVSKWAENNTGSAMALTNMAGQVISGAAAGQAEQERLDYEKRLQEEELARRAATGIAPVPVFGTRPAQNGGLINNGSQVYVEQPYVTQPTPYDANGAPVVQQPQVSPYLANR